MQVGMEMWARWAHKALWHDFVPGWDLHKSHHMPRLGPFEANDVFAIINAGPAIGLCLYGFLTPSLLGGLCFGAGGLKPSRLLSLPQHACSVWRGRGSVRACTASRPPAGRPLRRVGWAQMPHAPVTANLQRLAGEELGMGLYSFPTPSVLGGLCFGQAGACLSLGAFA